MNPEACCSSSCCYSSLQRTVRNYSRPSFSIRILSKTHQSSLTLNEVFFLKSPRPSFIDKAGFTRQFESELSLRSFAQLFPIKEGSTAFPKPLFSWRRLAALGNLKASFHCPHLHNLSPQGDRGCANRPTRCSNRFAIRLADHQRSRQQQSCGLRYATAWTKENEMAAESPKSPQQHAFMAKKPTAARPEGAEALSPGQRPGF